MDPLVSIIIPLFNAEKFVTQAIESVLKQTYVHWELIIVNDGSTDESFQIACSYESEKVKIFSKKNGGAAAARNYGYKQAKGEFIKFFDADDLINPEMIESQVKIALNNPDCIISGKWGRFYVNDLKTFQLNPEKCWQDSNPVDWIYSSWEKAQSMTQPAIFLLPKGLIERAGLWNEQLSLVDDFEFFTRIILSAKSVKFCSNAVLYYRSGITNSLSGLKSRKGVESELMAVELSTEYLMQHANSVKSKEICAIPFAHFLFKHYPTNKDLLKRAQLKLEALTNKSVPQLVSMPNGKLWLLLPWKFLKYLKHLKNGLSNA
ncbi:MAG: glycosyltransferase family 2 protein [Pedobacter sp.]|nr:MAG: glycosyltransferase family 2 protein [Pedobacter sp.]